MLPGTDTTKIFQHKCSLIKNRLVEFQLFNIANRGRGGGGDKELKIFQSSQLHKIDHKRYLQGPSQIPPAVLFNLKFPVVNGSYKGEYLVAVGLFDSYNK